MAIWGDVNAVTGRSSKVRRLFGQKVRDDKTEKESVHFRGTAFFVGIPLILNNAFLLCLVTARHNAEKLNHGEFCIRANMHNGLAEPFWLGGKEPVHWWYHPTDDSVDAAVLLWAPPSEVDFRFIPSNMFLTPEKIARKGIGVGDDVFITGLFTRLSGKTKNLPIVRTGNLAMIPPNHEKIPVGWKSSEIEAYLIEARSIGGLSGSPVFIQRSIEVQPAEHTGRKPIAAGAVFWLGLIHGHWDTPEDEIDVAQDNESYRKEQVNMGVAIVVPAHKIIETICQPAILARASGAIDKVLAEDHPIVTGNSPTGVWYEKRDEGARVITNIAANAEPPSDSRGDNVLAADFDRDDDSEPPISDENPNY
jgi:hypothetical protein